MCVCVSLCLCVVVVLLYVMMVVAYGVYSWNVLMCNNCIKVGYYSSIKSGSITVRTISAFKSANKIPYGSTTTNNNGFLSE